MGILPESKQIALPQADRTVANEVSKTHPEKKVFCGAYSTYRLPPLSIKKLPDNVLVQITNGRPIREMDDATYQRAAELRRQWQEKTNNPLSLTWNYTPFTNRGEYRPQYWPHIIARGLRDVQGQVWREDAWLSTDKGGLHHPGMNHLNPYVMSQLWWDPEQDVDVLLDEPFWTGYSLRGTLKDIRTGKRPKHSAEFRGRWWQDNVYFGIRCEGELGKHPVIGTRRNGDPAIWGGDHVELLIETDKHSYYQIVVNPAGAVMNLDRGASKAAWYDWSSQAEAVAHVGDGCWSVEVRLPITSSDEDPLHQIIGSRPFKTKTDDLASGKGTSLPWHFNLFRKRSGSEDGETTAFSPLGSDAKSFHDPMRFAEFHVP